MCKLFSKISAFLPKIILETSSKYNNSILVVQTGKTRKLIVNGLVQSFNYPSNFAKKRIWGNLADTAHKNTPDAKNFLILGMGAGTVIHYINEKYDPNYIQIRAVEIDDVIVEIAYKYFDLPLLTNTEVIVDDAYKYIKDNQNNDIDCVIMDTYLGDKLPNSFGEDKFLSDLFALGNKDTLFILNIVILRTSSNDVEKFRMKFDKYLKNTQIKKIDCKTHSDNYIYFGKKRSD